MPGGEFPNPDLALNEDSIDRNAAGIAKMSAENSD